MRALIHQAQKSGELTSLSNLLEKKYDLENGDEGWRVLIKILNAYKSPIFYVYTNYHSQNGY